MTNIHYYKANTKGRDFITSDIHGYFDILHDKLKEVAFDSTRDRLFCAGDLNDRGPYSVDCLDWLNEPWFICVHSNHQQMLMDAYENPYDRRAYEMLYMNGGAWYYNDLDPKLQKALYESFKSLPLAIELETKSGKTVGIVHAEVCYNSWTKFKNATKMEITWNVESTALWARTRYDKQDTSIVEGVDRVYVGHSPTNSGEVEVLGNVHYIDLGSFFRGKLAMEEIL